MPPGAGGRQRATRRMVSAVARRKPWSRNAASPYSEQLGVDPQTWGTRPETSARYVAMKRREGRGGERGGRGGGPGGPPPPPRGVAPPPPPGPATAPPGRRGEGGRAPR